MFNVVVVLEYSSLGNNASYEQVVLEEQAVFLFVPFALWSRTWRIGLLILYFLFFLEEQVVLEVLNPLTGGCNPCIVLEVL